MSHAHRSSVSRELPEAAAPLHTHSEAPQRPVAGPGAYRHKRPLAYRHRLAAYRRECTCEAGRREVGQNAARKQVGSHSIPPLCTATIISHSIPPLCTATIISAEICTLGAETCGLDAEICGLDAGAEGFLRCSFTLATPTLSHYSRIATITLRTCALHRQLIAPAVQWRNC